MSLQKLGLTSVILLALALTNCTLRKPEREVPAPNDRMVNKGLFFENGVFGKGAKPRIFAFGAAAESEIGQLGSIVLHHTNEVDHTNVIFTIEEAAVVGHKLDPSFPNEQSRWKKIIEIPIRRHFTREQDKDNYGRTRNKDVDAEHSHWSARPMMELDYANIQIYGEAAGYMGWLGGGRAVSGLEDLELDVKNGFIAFTRTETNNWYQDEFQIKRRYNFMAFKNSAESGDTKFTPTPYHESMSNYLNVLHILGKQIEGVKPVLYAGRWNAKKLVKEKRKIYLQNFPKEYVDIGIATVEAWNQAFRDAQIIGKNERVFVHEIANNVKHPFDLRRVSITWIADRKISMNAPLGVGTAVANVQTGEFLWAGITIWGGGLESYVRANMPTSTIDANAILPQLAFIEGLDNKIMNSPRSTMAPGIGVGAQSEMQSRLANYLKSRVGVYQKLSKDLASNPSLLIGRKRKEVPLALGVDMDPNQTITVAEMPTIHQAIQNSIFSMTNMNVEETATWMAKELSQEALSAQAEAQRYSSLFTRESIREILGLPTVSQSVAAFAKATGLDPKAVPVDGSDSAKTAQFMKHHQQRALTRAARMDAEMTLANMGVSLLNAAGKDLDFTAAIRAEVRFLLMHEYGHIMGSGHNFKENIVPDKGSVPEHYRVSLEAKANKAHQWTNFSTVMGYVSPQTMVHIEEKDVAPGPHDVLMLRYLYRGEFAIYRDGVADFDYVKVSDSGKIPSEVQGRDGKVWKTSYFPQCNDYVASLDLDPFCNRFDRGSSAQDLVANYVDFLNQSLGTNLYAFTDDREMDHELLEAALWGRFFVNLNRIRLFYDEMRQKYSKQIQEISSSPTWEQNLLQFSDVCQNVKGVTNNELSVLFKNYPKIKDLCIANAYAIRMMGQFMSPPGWDYTQIDYSRRFTPAGLTGGDAQVQHSNMFGTWMELSTLPVKIPALMTLTAPHPRTFFGGFGWPNFIYSGETGRYLYQTLYPKEYTEAIAQAVKENIKLQGFGQNPRPIMGKSIMAMGWALNRADSSNDSLRTDSQYMESIRRQTEFDVDIQFVILKAVENRDNNQRVKKFTATLYDFRSGKELPMAEAYLLPGGNVIAMPIENIMIYSPKPIRVFSNDSAFTVTYRMDYYSNGYKDFLESRSVKASLRSLYDAAIRACIDGPDERNPNGLQYFFNDDKAATSVDFEGFKMTAETYTSPNEKGPEFFRSIDLAFEKYYENKTTDKNTGKEKLRFGLKPTYKTCENSMRGQRLILNAAGALNGYYLPGAIDDIEKSTWW